MKEGVWKTSLHFQYCFYCDTSYPFFDAPISSLAADCFAFVDGKVCEISFNLFKITKGIKEITIE